MKKTAIFLIIATIILFSTASCTENVILPKPNDTDLEFWVGEKTTEDSFKDHQQLFDIFGGEEYLGKGYYTEDPHSERPDYYVAYTLTAYPDYSSNNGAYDTVTYIYINDPSVRVAGITCNSSAEEFCAVFENLGCTISTSGLAYIATYKDTQISFIPIEGNSAISIRLEVSNKEGIVF